MVDVAKVKAVITANTTQFNAKMKKVSMGLSAVGGKFTRFGEIGRAGFLAIQGAAVAAGAAITLGLAVKGVKAFVAFEDQMTKTAAIMGGDSLQAIQKTTDKVMELGRETRSTAVEVGEAAQILALAGLKEDDLVDNGALEQLNNLAIAAGVDMPTAAGVAISSLKGMGMETSELGRVSDVMMQTMTNSFTTIESLGQTMKFLAPTAFAAGISLEEAAAAAGALGNAGLQGTMAGTGMRMAINKLIKPTGEARRVIEDLNLNVFRLTPAGEAAKQALAGVDENLQSTKMQADGVNAAMKALNAELSDLSIEQQQNSLAIAKIRQRAAREGRELTEREIEQIERLDMANNDLNITMQERQLEVAVQKREFDRLSESISAQQTEYDNLNQTVIDQTMGLTSLADVFATLRKEGATTSQILQVFGVRGGNAVNAIMAQSEAFEDLIEKNEDAQDRTSEMVEVMTGTAFNAFKELNSVFTELLINIGAQFAPMIINDLVPALKAALGEGGSLVPMFKSMADSLAVLLPQLIDAFVPVLIQMAENGDELVYVIVALAHAIRFLMIFVEPVFELLAGIGMVFKGLEEMNPSMIFQGLGKAAGGLALILAPIFRMVEAIAEFLGIIDEEGSDLQRAGSGALKGAAAGAVVGSAVPVVGTAAGAVVGGLVGAGMTMFAEGGIVNEATLGIFGEAGTEAVIPLDRLPDLMAQSMNTMAAKQGGTKPSQTINFNGNITIGEGNNLNKRDVEEIIVRTLPQALNQSSMRGARGVF